MVKRKRHSIGPIVLMLILGSVFIALGIGVLIALISSLIGADIADIGIAIVVPIILLVLLPIAMGSIPLIMAIKEIYHIIREKKAIKSDIETTARIVDYKTVSRNGRLNKRYALKLSYYLNGEQKTFTTDYLFDINELKYLRSLSQITIKVDGNFVAVTEPFSDDIYKIETRYGIPIEFFTQSIVKKTLRIFWILCPIVIAFLIISIILTSVLNNGIYLIVAVILFVAFNIPFAVILTVCLIKWIKKIRK